jgi:3',5'-cyclic-AMP phosphodiesterase
MPIHLAPGDRRQFLTGLAGFFITLPVLRLGAATDDIDPDLVVLLNDTHISEKHTAATPIRRNLESTVASILALPRRPAAVFINGDLAMRDGQPGDYRLFAQLIAPLRSAGLPIHLTMGNHDNRDVFYEVLSAEKSAAPPVAQRHVSVVRTRQANFILCDSLLRTMLTEGDLGSAQLAWIGRALESDPRKPAILLVHHNPRRGADPTHFPGGLTDTDPLWTLLESRAHVKAYVHGHVHRWARTSHGGIHIINTPATSYVGDPKLSTPGWTLARLRPGGMTVTTFTYATDHPWNNQVHDFAWRTGV